MNSTFSQSDTDTILSKIGINTAVLSDEEKSEMMDKIDSHMNEVILETVASSLSSGQIEHLRTVLDSGDEESFLYELEEISKHIPGLDMKIDAALKEEFNMIALAKNRLD